MPYTFGWGCARPEHLPAWRTLLPAAASCAVKYRGHACATCWLQPDAAAPLLGAAYDT